MTTRYFRDKGINPPKQKEQVLFSFIYPDLPPREWNPNKRFNRFAKHSAGVAAADRLRTTLADIGVLCPNPNMKDFENGTDSEMFIDGPIPNPIIEISWGLPDRHARDWDNLVASMKPLLDRLVKLQFIKDDSVRDYTPRYLYFESPKDPKTIIKFIGLVDDD